MGNGLWLLVVALGAATACNEPSSMEPDVDEGAAPLDVQALLWCLSCSGEGTTADGESVTFSGTRSDPGACLCIPVGMQPTTGSELDQALHDMALERCEEELAALGAVTTRCDEYVSRAIVDYKEPCEPDEWPPLPT